MRKSRYFVSVTLLAWLAGCSREEAIDAIDSVASTQQALSGSVLYVANGTTLGSADNALRNRLETKGFTVQVKAANASTSADANGRALVVISSTVNPSDVNTKFRDVTAPVLTWESQLFDDMGMTSATGLGTASAQRNVNVTNSSHPMAAGLSGSVAVSTVSSTFNWGAPAAGATRVANIPTYSNRAAIFSYAAGARLASGQAARGNRVGFFFGDTTASSLTSNGWSLFDKAVEWAVGAITAPTKVEISVSDVDDFVYLTVNDVRRRVWTVGQSDARLDISQWFAQGSNSVRIQAIDTSGIGPTTASSYSVQLWVDGQQVLNESCTAAPCDSSLAPPPGITFDRTINVQAAGLPAKQTVTVNGPSGGKLYLEDAFTGRSTPTTLQLPQGTYRLAVGTSQDVPPNYTGRYQEQSIQVGSNALTVDLSQAPTVAPKSWKVAILPIRETIHYTGGPTNTGLLIDADLPRIDTQANQTSSKYVAPFTYGLANWTVTRLPVVEPSQARLYRTNPSEGPDTDQLLRDAGLESLKQNYDFIIYFYSIFTADRKQVANSPCCYWGGGQGIAYTDGAVQGDAANQPNFYLLHESLHVYEQQNRFYNGLDGDHGADEHGYPYGAGGEVDFVNYYRAFMRNQVIETRQMRIIPDGGTPWPSPVAPPGDLAVGTFDVFRVR